jgi:hypothetical protein
MCSREALQILIGGDFNIPRRLDEKNKSNYNDRWPLLFNVVIDGLNLRELEMTDMNYTWANSLDDPTYEKLDRILICTQWEQKFPLSTLVASTRDILGHTPLILDTGQTSSCNSITMFKFKLGWLLRDGFANIVKNIWLNEKAGSTPMEKWQAKIRRLRQHLRGWAKNVSGAYKKEKKTY